MKKSSDYDHDLFSEDKSVLTFEFPGAAKEPSTRWGLKLSLPLWIAFVLLAGAFVVTIMYCIRFREARRAADKKEKQVELSERVKDALTCTNPDEGGDVTETTFASDPFDEPTEHDLECGDETDYEECLICSKPMHWQNLAVYKSNNLSCNHLFHAECIDNWLKYQNTCPACNRPFVMLTGQLCKNPSSKDIRQKSWRHATQTLKSKAPVAFIEDEPSKEQNS